jgi:hypothetical protein
MTTYILLRNNKETGPFQLEQLREMGLKANDLIWVEGQSASWRNPTEINELRNLVVSSSPAQTNNKVDQKHPTELSSPNNTGKQGPDTEKRHIFVALPPDPEKSSANELAAVAPAPAVLKDPEEFKPVEKPKEEIETKYAMSLDEIKERYVKTLESRKNSRKGISLGIPEPIKRVAVYAGVFILGAAIVLLLVRPDRSGPVAGEQKKQPASFEDAPVEEVAASNSDPESEIMLPESYYDSQSSGEGKEYSPTQQTPQKTPVKQEPARPEEKEDVSAIAEDELDDRISIPRDEIPGIRSVSPVEIAEQVSVKANSYTIAALGGIRDLELTIRNGSEFTLDKVTVEVRYLNPKGVIVKTEDVQFKSIQPNGSQTIGMKKSNRGVKVTQKIIRIESKEFGTHIAGN